IVPSNTYIATILAVMQAGHKPVLVEPDLKTYNIDPTLIEAAITSSTRAIMIVHLYGKSCEMSRIISLCEKYNIALIEDCAQAHGTKYNGKAVGTFGIGAFSFYPTKNLGALGDAGAVITQDEKIFNELRMLRNYGSQKKYYNERIGYNSRLDEIQAAMLKVKLKYLNAIVEHKRKLAARYFDALTDEVIKPSQEAHLFDSFHIFSIRTSRREQLREWLLKKEIKTEVHYPVAPMNQVAMEGLFDEGSFPIAEEIHRTTLSLPISFANSEAEIDQVVSAVNGFFK
ncbi:MAG: DegT/DnrJ/EryC1/StrS family aminotransferase, partial [Chryseobacterium sp.]